MFLALGLVLSVAFTLVAAVLAVLAFWLAVRHASTNATASFQGGTGTVRFPANASQRCKILIGVGIAWAIFGAPFVSLGFGEGWWAFPLMLLVLRRRMLLYQLHLDSKRMWHEPLRAGTRTLYWARLKSVRLVGHWLVLTDGFDAKAHVSRYLDGLGALAVQIDDHAAPAVEIDGRARELLLGRYRLGLKQAGEDVEAWFAKRNGPLSRHVKPPRQPEGANQGVVRVRNRA